MSKKKSTKKQNKSNDYLSLPRLELSDKAKRSILTLLLIGLGLLSFLGLFNLSGRFGGFVSQWLQLIFGFGKWLVPVMFIYWALITYRRERQPLKFTDYLGLGLLFIAYQTLFHFFYDPEVWLAQAEGGTGGGYLGYFFGRLFFYLFGFWGGLVVLLAILLSSLVLVFNTSLTKIIGRESLVFRFAKPFGLFFRNLFSQSHEEEEIEEEEEENIIIEEEVESDEVLKSWQEKELFEEESPSPARQRAKSKRPAVQEKIVWPKRSVKIDLPLELLNDKYSQAIGGDTEINALKISKTLEKFGIEVEMGETKVGPTVTQYTFRPAAGVKLSRITTLNNDLSLSLAAHPIRIEAPIPGKSLVGVEVPNKAKAIVGLREILADQVFKERKNNLFVVLGKDVAGTAWLYDLTKMPHLLVAGATNSGKSVCLNAIIVSLLYQNNPEDLRFIMVDPKRVELPTYNGIPHLLTPVITDVNKTINALKWCLNEMERRYDLLNQAGKRNIQSYNQTAAERLPYIVFIIDELADFMMTSGKEMEAAIIRLAQMSRAIGIHLILATQRPSVDVITGLIKANVPTRIAFSVASLVDSKTILDSSGAEKLLGQGDMLFSSAEFAKPKRIQGAYLSDEEINDVVNYIKEKSGPAEYLEGVTDRQKVGGNAGVGLDGTRGDEDELFEEAKEIIVRAGKASTSMLQRRLSIGYGRAAKILDMLEDSGIIGPPNGSKPREVLVSQEQYEAMNEGEFIAGIPIHNRAEAKQPDSYLAGDEGNDDTLVFSNQSTEEDLEAETEAELSLSPEELEEVVNDETEILEEIREDDDVEVDSVVSEEEEEPALDEEDKPSPLTDDDEMFFAR